MLNLDIMNREIWQPIPEWPEYAASSHGRIKRVFPEQGARIGHILKPHVSKTTGYQYVVLNRTTKSCTKTVHRLTALTFLGAPPTPKHQCNHLNGNKIDNRRENLEWVTHSENARHAYRLGLTKSPLPQRGELSTSCTIPEVVAQAILDAPRGYGTGKELAKRFKTTKYVVSLIRNRRSWKHLVSAVHPNSYTPKFHHTSQTIIQAILHAPTGYGTGRKLSKQFGVTEWTVSKIRHQAKQMAPPGLFLQRQH